MIGNLKGRIGKLRLSDNEILKYFVAIEVIADEYFGLGHGLVVVVSVSVGQKLKCWTEARKIAEIQLCEKRKRSEPGRRKNSCTPKRSSSPGALEIVGLDLLLHVVHHRHGSDQDDGRNDLVWVKAGMEKAPGDAHGGQRLHHLEVTCC